MEVWKDIVGYEGLYQVSNMGRVKSLPRTWKAGNGCIRRKGETILRESSDVFGYKRVPLSRNGGHKRLFVHRLVAEAFLPNIYRKKEVNHKNGIKWDNTAENLEWCTRSENIKHAFSAGLAQPMTGVKHHQFGKRRGKSHCAKPVLDVITGVFYDCAKDAAEAKGINYRTLGVMLSGHRRNKTSLRYI